MPKPNHARVEAAAARDFTDELVRAIATSGLRDTELAAKTGVHASAIGRFKRRQRDLTFGNAARIAACLGLRLTRPKRGLADLDTMPSLALSPNIPKGDEPPCVT